MKEITSLCPKCTETYLQFQIEQHSAEDGRWYVAGFIQDEQECDCEFSDTEIATMEVEIANEYAEGVYAFQW